MKKHCPVDNFKESRSRNLTWLWHGPRHRHPELACMSFQSLGSFFSSLSNSSLVPAWKMEQIKDLSKGLKSMGLPFQRTSRLLSSWCRMSPGERPLADQDEQIRDHAKAMPLSCCMLTLSTTERTESKHDPVHCRPPRTRTYYHRIDHYLPSGQIESTQYSSTVDKCGGYIFLFTLKSDF